MEEPFRLITDAKAGVGQPTQTPKEKKAFAGNEVPASPGAQPQTTIGTARKILVLDDNPVVLKAFELKLQANGFAVITISDAASVGAVAEKGAAELWRFGLEWLHEHGMAAQISEIRWNSGYPDFN